MRVKIEVVIESDAPTEKERIIRWMVIHAIEEMFRELAGMTELRVSAPGIWTTEGGERSITRELASVEGGQ